MNTKKIFNVMNLIGVLIGGSMGSAFADGPRATHQYTPEQLRNLRPSLSESFDNLMRMNNDDDLSEAFTYLFGSESVRQSSVQFINPFHEFQGRPQGSSVHEFPMTSEQHLQTLLNQLRYVQGQSSRRTQPVLYISSPEEFITLEVVSEDNQSM